MSAADCIHLGQVQVARPKEVRGCEECLATGSDWVNLRVCRTCGRIGCCDSSPGKHASAHARSAGHPIVSSAEPGERWSWCYEDELAFVLEGD